MPVSRELAPDDQQLVRYLLGLLPDDEAERLDEASIVDDDVAGRLRGVEDDLVDSYVSGTLDSETRARFEQHYLQSPRRREKVEFAKRFLDAVDREPRTVSATESAASRSKFSWVLLSAAALLLLACGALVLEEFRLRDGIQRTRQEAAAQGRQAQELARQLDDARAASGAAAQELARARAELATHTQQPGGAAPAASTTFLAIVLSPQTRSIGPLPAVALAAAADRLSFDLRLESNDFSRYLVTLKDPSVDREVWRSGPLTARTGRGGSFVSVTVPAATLGAQHYSFELAGVDRTGRSETLGSYAFQIDRR